MRTDCDVIILCGGKGTRLAPLVSDRPKPLAEVGGVSFLDILLKKIWEAGLKRVILTVSHMKEQFIEKYAHDERILFSEEDEPLDTGGAVKKALTHATTPQVIVMNGDSYAPVDLDEMLAKHLQSGRPASLAVTEIDDISDRGSVRVEKDIIVGFEEKLPVKQSGLVNAGVYIFDTSIKEHMPPNEKFSLEKELFPALAAQGLCNAHVIVGGVFDIGVPERYLVSEDYFKNI